MKKKTSRVQYLNSKYKDLIIFIGLVLCSIPLIIPYFKSGYFPTHDGEWAVVRLAEMFREIKDFQFPPRYSNVLNNGYGYPLFNFAYPFPYYVALLFKFLGLGFIESIKLFFAITVPLSGIGMYLLSRSLWKSHVSGLITALLYMYLPYRMVDLYVRGSIGESLALAIVPYLLFTTIKIKDAKKPYMWMSIAAVLLASLILTHNIMAVYFVPLYVLFCLMYVIFYEKKKILSYIFSIVLGIGLSAFFWFPALFEKNNILLSIIPIADRSLYYVSFLDLIIPSWGYEIPTDGTAAFSYQLGMGVIAAIIATLISFAMGRKEKLFDLQKIAAVLFLIWIMMLLMLFEPSGIIWEHLPILSEINYPWTLLAPLGFVGTLLAGFVVSKNKTFLYIFVGVVLVNGILVVRYAKPEYYVNHGEGYYSTNQATTTSSNEYTPLWVKEIPRTSPKQKAEIMKGTGTIDNIVTKSNMVSFTARMSESGVVRINTTYYPGWRVFVNNTMTNFTYKNTYGVLDVPLQAGEYSVEAKFVETKPRLLSDIVSLTSGLLIGGVFILGIFTTIKVYAKEKK